MLVLAYAGVKQSSRGACRDRAPEALRVLWLDRSMMEPTPENDPSEPRPSLLQHLLFVGVIWALLPFVYWEDYGWPGEPPRVPYGGNWITLDLTGLMTMAYLWFAGFYTALTTWVFLRARKRPRQMSWAEYLLYVPAAAVGVIGVWYAYLVVD
jgi:hypothetical protein